MTDKSQQNGSATANGKANGVKTETITTPVVKVETPKIEAKTHTLAEQRARAQTLNDLLEKEEKLVNSKNSLKSFVAASDDDTNKLDLRDGKGRTFTTGNPAVIAEVVKLVMKTLDEKINDVQLKIINA